MKHDKLNEELLNLVLRSGLNPQEVVGCLLGVAIVYGRADGFTDQDFTDVLRLVFEEERAKKKPV